MNSFWLASTIVAMICFLLIFQENQHLIETSHALVQVNKDLVQESKDLVRKNRIFVEESKACGK
jgi:beta-lactamase regulating signal transducer with metallopeptidase domain